MNVYRIIGAICIIAILHPLGCQRTAGNQFTTAEAKTISDFFGLSLDTDTYCRGLAVRGDHHSSIVYGRLECSPGDRSGLVADLRNGRFGHLDLTIRDQAIRSLVALKLSGGPQLDRVKWWSPTPPTFADDIYCSENAEQIVYADVTDSNALYIRVSLSSAEVAKGIGSIFKGVRSKKSSNIVPSSSSLTVRP